MHTEIDPFSGLPIKNSNLCLKLVTLLREITFFCSSRHYDLLDQVLEIIRDLFLLY